MEFDFELFDNYFMKIKKEMHKHLSKTLEKFHLSSTNVKVIVMLYKNHSLSQKQLKEIIGLDKANITRSINGLKEKGYVQIPENIKRGYKIELTVQGKKIAKKIEIEMKKNTSKFFDNLSEEEKQVLVKILDKFLLYVKEEI